MDDGSKQAPRAAKQWMVGGFSIANGPVRTFATPSSAAAQLHHTSHSPRAQNLEVCGLTLSRQGCDPVLQWISTAMGVDDNGVCGCRRDVAFAGISPFAVEGQQIDVIHCHCNFCQRATGSAYLIETLFMKEQFRLLHGTPRVFIHTSAGSGKHVHVHFREICGIKTPMLFERFPDTVAVYPGTFDEEDWFADRPEKTLYFYLSNAPVGTVLPAGHQVFDAHYWRSDGVAADAQIFDTHTLVTEHLKAESKKRVRDPER